MELEKRNGVTPILVQKVILHEHPDLDAIGAYWLAKTFSQIGFLGIEDAPIEFWPQGAPPDGKTAEEHEKEGTVCFDVAEGRFDHHPHGKCPDKCAADLVAEFLGVRDDQSLKNLLDYIRMYDLEGPTSLSRRLRDEDYPEEIVRKVSLLENQSLANVISNERSALKNEKSLISRVCRHLSAFYLRQLYFWKEVQEEFKEKAKFFTVNSGVKSYRVAVIESDLADVGSFSRTKEGGNCDVCIHSMPKLRSTAISGNISSEQFQEIDNPLRVWEMKRRNITDEYTFADLIESKMPQCTVWYLPKNTKGEVFIVMNRGKKTFGSETIEPTVLTQDEMCCAVSWGLEDKYSKMCPRTHCLFHQCDFYPFFFERCRKIRQQTV